MHHLFFKATSPRLSLTSPLCSVFSHLSLFYMNSASFEVVSPTMADRSQPHQVQVHTQHRYEGGIKGGPQQQRGPSASKVLAVIAMLPVGGGLLALAGITLVGTLIGLAITTPVFLLFSPVLVPAALVLAFAVTSFLASGAFGLTGLTSLSWFVNYFRQASQAVPEQLDQAKRRMQDMAGYVGQKTKEVGQEVQRKTQHEGK